MIAPGKGLDPLLKEIIQACTDLPRADAGARRAFWAALEDWQTRLDNLGTTLRIGGSVAPMGGMGARGGDPRAEQRPEEARRALLGLHFGLPPVDGGAVEKHRADLDHLQLAIESSEVLAVDAGVRQRLGMVQAKAVLVRSSVPVEVHVEVLGLLVRCYRALHEEATRPDPPSAPPPAGPTGEDPGSAAPTDEGTG